MSGYDDINSAFGGAASGMGIALQAGQLVHQLNQDKREKDEAEQLRLMREQQMKLQTDTNQRAGEQFEMQKEAYQIEKGKRVAGMALNALKGIDPKNANDLNSWAQQYGNNIDFRKAFGIPDDHSIVGAVDLGGGRYSFISDGATGKPQILTHDGSEPQEGNRVFFTPQTLAYLAGIKPDEVSASDLVQVAGPDGNPTFIKASEAVGKTAYEKRKPLEDELAAAELEEKNAHAAEYRANAAKARRSGSGKKPGGFEDPDATKRVAAIYKLFGHDLGDKLSAAEYNAIREKANGMGITLYKSEVQGDMPKNAPIGSAVPKAYQFRSASFTKDVSQPEPAYEDSPRYRFLWAIDHGQTPDGRIADKHQIMAEYDQMMGRNGAAAELLRNRYKHK